MNRTSTLFTLFVIAAAIISLANSGGAPAARTGAPNESTCGASGCHGVQANQGSATLEINFAEESTVYEAGETYRINVSIDGAQNANKNGFEIVALDANDNNVGEWILALPDDTQTKSSSGREYVTHTRAGNERDNWDIDWKAPAEDAGSVTFYVAFLDANGNGSSSGDALYTGNTSVDFDVASSTALIAEDRIQVYPNPATNFLTIESSSDKINSYQLFNVAGQLVREGAYNRNVEVGDLDNGLYVLRLETSKGIVHQKVMIE